MFWDRYCIHYCRGEKNFSVNDPNAKLVIDCELRGEKLPPFGPAPHVLKRIGIELHPVDLQNADDRDWQCALMWPDQPERLVRMRKAIEIALKEKLDVRAGDAVRLLPEILKEMPGEGSLCVYHTNVLYQFPQAAREALDSILLDFSQKRALWRLAFEEYK